MFCIKDLYVLYLAMGEDLLTVLINKMRLTNNSKMVRDGTIRCLTLATSQNWVSIINENHGLIQSNCILLLFDFCIKIKPTI